MTEHDKRNISQNLSKSIIRVMESDLVIEDQRSKINSLIKTCAMDIGRDYLYKAFDAVCEHFKNPNALMNLLPESPTLNQDGFIINPEAIEALGQFIKITHERGVPIFLHSAEIQPTAILPLEVYNALVEKIDERMIVDKDRIFTVISGQIVKQTDKEQ